MTKRHDRIVRPVHTTVVNHVQEIHESPMQTRLILNPTAGGKKAGDWLLPIHARLRAEVGSLDVVITTQARDAEDAARDAVAHGVERLFIAGGDGTLNEALNGVLQVEGALTRTTFGLIPMGTGNDFAESIGIPATDLEASFAALFGGRVAAVDVGLVNDRAFVNVSAGGFVADVSEAVSSPLKTVTGRLAYLIGGAQQIFEYEPVEMSFRADGGVSKSLSMQLFAVCNARLIGGGRPIAPHAIIDDGKFDVCIVESMTAREFLAVLAKVPSGQHVADDRVSYFRASSLETSFARSTHVNTDGEVIEATSCRYRLLHRAARFYVGPALEPSILL